MILLQGNFIPFPLIYQKKSEWKIQKKYKNNINIYKSQSSLQFYFIRLIH